MRFLDRWLKSEDHTFIGMEATAMLLPIDRLIRMNRRRSWEDDIDDRDRRLLWDSARQLERLSRLVLRQAQMIEMLEADVASEQGEMR